jgi:hypothetical protein
MVEDYSGYSGLAILFGRGCKVNKQKSKAQIGGSINGHQGQKECEETQEGAAKAGRQEEIE